MKVLGIIAIVLAIVAIFLPAVSLYVTWLAFFLASIAAFSREAMLLAVLTSLIGTLNIMVFSPLTLATIVVVFPMLFLTIILGAAPVVIALIRLAMGTKTRSTVKVLRT